MIEYDDPDQISTFLLQSSHSGRKFIEGRAPLASFACWRVRSTAGPFHHTT